MAYDLGLADRIRLVLRPAGPFAERKMFGGLCFLVNGRMCCGVMKTDLVLRLTPEAAAEALREPHVRPMDFTGKPMKSMIYVAAAGVDSDSSLESWVKSAEAIARTLPAKVRTKTSRERAHLPG
jgi:TfoX/Sxy family transcriptional regulator of competence genes